MSMGTGKFLLLLSIFTRVMMMLPRRPESRELLAGWHQMKFNINDNIKPNIPIEIKTGKSSTTSTQWFLSQLMKAKSEYQPLFGELLLAEAAITLPVSNAWPERGASALKIVKN